MPNNQEPTRFDTLKRWLLNNRAIAIIVLVFIIVVGLGSFTKALQDIASFVRQIVAGNTPTPIAVQVYYAVFGIRFPEGAWSEGKTYSYSIDLRECGKDNFIGSTVSFGVAAGSADVPFFLLKDGVYDNADRNIARPVNASPSQASYAVVVLPRSSEKDAEQVMATCKALINIVSGPALALLPNQLGAIGGFAGHIDLSNAQLQLLHPAPPGIIP